MFKHLLLFLITCSLSLCYADGKSSAPHVESLNERSQLINLLTGSIISRTLYSLAELKVADQITDIPTHVDVIAQAVGAQPDALYRALRLAASYDVFKEGPNHFSLMPLGALLQTTHQDSMYYLALHEDEARWQALGGLTHSVVSGEQSFKHVHGMNYFDYLRLNKEASQRFDASMATISAEENRTIARCFDFSTYQSVMDVGGGYGGLIQEIVKACPRVKGVLCDLPQVVSQPSEALAEVAKHCTIVEGNFFESIPAISDLYILKRILHDWDDTQAEKILKNCAAVLGDSRRLLVIDAIVPEGNDRHIIKDIDVLLMALFGGKERTEAEFRKLFNAAGLRLIKVWPTQSLLSIFELEVDDATNP